MTAQQRTLCLHLGLQPFRLKPGLSLHGRCKPIAQSFSRFEAHPPTLPAMRRRTLAPLRGPSLKQGEARIHNPESLVIKGGLSLKANRHVFGGHVALILHLVDESRVDCWVFSWLLLTPRQKV